MNDDNQKWRILGIKNRYWILVFVILSVIGAMYYWPVLPHIQLPAEAYPHTTIDLSLIGSVAWTNTLTAMVIADIILILIAFLVRRSAQSGAMVPKGLAGAIEALLEVLHNLTEATAGKWTKAIFPFFATITLLVLVVNWLELIPGVDSIGFLHADEHGCTKEVLVPGLIATIAKPCAEDLEEEVAAAEGSAEAAAAEGEHLSEGEHDELWGIIPYVRVLSTDLNFTVALALVSVFMTQVFGYRSLGMGYFKKFINVGGVFSRPVFGVIDFAVGILELISEVSKIISFSFRLFGNIFAGSVLLFVIGSLIPVFLQSGFLLLEFFVGLIQAVVFGMLTMVFMSQAVAGHGDHGEEHAH